jgi:hypothetical protein
MHFVKSILGFSLLAFCLPLVADAGLILGFQTSGTITANQSGQASTTVTVRVASDVGIQTLKAYDLFVDIAPAGTALPSGWTLGLRTELTDYDLFSSSINPSQGNVSASAAQLFSSSINVTTTSMSLWSFQLSFDGSTGAVDGTYGLNFLTGGNFSLVDASNANITPTLQSGSITLSNFSAVPEPSSALLFAGAVITAYRVRSRRGRRRTETTKTIVG